MAEIALIHSALGVTPGIIDAADRLRAAGHTVHVLDLYEGRGAFTDYAPAMAYIGEVGPRALAGRARAAADKLPSELVYAGFSIGGGFATRLAATRPGAKGALLLMGAAAPAQLMIEAWPAGVPVQIHFKESDPYRDGAAIAAITEFVRASGSSCDSFDYPGTAHLFADSSLPAEYDAEASELLWTRVEAFLKDVDAS